MKNEQGIVQLIDACKKGEQTAERRLFNHFAPVVMAIARRYARDEPQALDFLQDCFIHVFDKLDRFDAQKGSFEAWLHRVSVNVILMILRKTKHSSYVELTEELESPAEEFNALEQLDEQTILTVIRQLPHGYREVFNLYVFEQWTHREIADSLGITESSSRSQLARGRALIQKNIYQIVHTYEKRVV